MKTTVLTVLFMSCAAAQPPTLIRMVRNGSIQPYIDGRTSANVVGMTSISGPAETWLIELHDSFGSLEDADKSLSTVSAGVLGAAPYADDALPGTRTMIARYRPELSYMADQAIRVLPRTRYVDVMVCRVRPGGQADFAAAVKLREFSRDSVNLDRPEMVYEVISGAPSETYIFLAPLTSLKILDDGRPPTPLYAEGAGATARKAAANAEIFRERLWFRIEPRVSYVSEEFAAPDSKFWHPGR